MARSKRFKILQEEVSRLRRYFLPQRFDPMGEYSDRVRGRALGFRVLVHAEIEAFLEDRAVEVALSAIREWKKKSTPSRTLMCLLSFVEQDPPGTLQATQPSQRKTWPVRVDVTSRLDSAMKAFQTRVNSNHGLREENILSLLLPIGVSASLLDPLLITDLNNFADRRGEAAHTSWASNRAKTVVDPMSEWDAIKNLLAQLKPLDEEITKLLNRVGS